jgi:hypothetical protein
MGLKGYRLWVMGQLDSTCRAPPRGAPGRRKPCAMNHIVKAGEAGVFIHFRRCMKTR